MLRNSKLRDYELTQVHMGKAMAELESNHRTMTENPAQTFQWLPIEIRLRPEILPIAWDDVHALALGYLMDFISNYAATLAYLLFLKQKKLPLDLNALCPLGLEVSSPTYPQLLSGLCLTLTSSERLSVTTCPRGSILFYLFS